MWRDSWTAGRSIRTSAGGVSAQNLGSGSQIAVTAVAIQPDGEILAAGVAGDIPTGAPTAAAVDLYFAGEADGAIVRVDDDHATDTFNPTPALPLSGDASVPANTPYTLTLGDGMADLGSGSNISYVVHWGDGNSDPPISAETLAGQNDQVTHTFTTTTTGITVDLEVGGTTYQHVGSQPVSVDFSDVTTTQLAVGNPSPSFGDSVTLTATVTATGTPGGTVEFYDGTMDLGPGTLALNGSYDQATLNTPPLTFGTHSFTAIYGGDGTFDQSTSTPATASVGSSVHGPLTITASEAQGCGVRPRPAANRGRSRHHPVDDLLGRRDFHERQKHHANASANGDADPYVRQRLVHDYGHRRQFRRQLQRLDERNARPREPLSPRPHRQHERDDTIAVSTRSTAAAGRAWRFRAASAIRGLWSRTR